MHFLNSKLYFNKTRIHIVILLFSLFFTKMLLLASDINSENLPVHHTKDGFRNLYLEDPQKNFFSFIAMRFFGEEQWAEHAQYAEKIPHQMLDLQKVQQPVAQPQISWLGHSTFLIQYQNINILTDPIFSDYASFTSLAGPQRYVPHVVNYDDLPQIDYVIISHNHYDHLDEPTIIRLQQQKEMPHFYVPLGIGEWLADYDIPAEKFTEMDWWDSQRMGDLQITATPSQHWSARGLFDRRETLWASWYVQIAGFQFWFAGDTGFNERLFKEIGTSIGEVDLALIPIGAYAPRDFMKPYHINPAEAVKIHQLINAKQSVGMHWGTFPLSAEDPTEPPRLLKEALVDLNLDEGSFRALTLGETLILKDEIYSDTVAEISTMTQE